MTTVDVAATFDLIQILSRLALEDHHTSQLYNDMVPQECLIETLDIKSTVHTVNPQHSVLRRCMRRITHL